MAIATLAPAPQPCSRQQHWRQRAPLLPPLLPPHPLAARRQRSRLSPPHASAASIDEEPALSEDEPLSSTDDVPSSSGSGSPDGGSMRRDAWRVPIPPHLHGKAPRKHWNANALAFLGDSVWELYTRRRFFYPPSRKESYFSLVVEHVRAETQERLHQQLLASDFLTATERDVLRWGRNATGVTPKRLSDTGLKRETYRAATAMECLAGYLYLSDPERLHAMMSLLGLGDAPAEGGEAGSSGSADIDSSSSGGDGGS